MVMLSVDVFDFIELAFNLAHKQKNVMHRHVWCCCDEHDLQAIVGGGN